MRNFSELGTLLTREEARKIRGGASGQVCNYDGECPPGLTCSNGVCGTGTCGYVAWTGDAWFPECNISKSAAMDGYNHWSGTTLRWWCCDSCASTWYCGGQ